MFDAVGTVILLLDFLSNNETTIENLLREIPSTHTLSTNISYNTEKQPALLKKICESHNITADSSEDAIKINFDNGWVILIPQKTESAIRIISHALSMEYAQEISDIFTDEITKGWQKGKSVLLPFCCSYVTILKVINYEKYKNYISQK